MHCCTAPLRAGKSTLLVALLHFLLHQRGLQGSPLAGARVLVSAHTNVAVDRVLLGGWAALRVPERSDTGQAHRVLDGRGGACCRMWLYRQRAKRAARHAPEHQPMTPGGACIAPLLVLVILPPCLLAFLLWASACAQLPRSSPGLLESGCTDFLRVGPLRRISRRLLGQSLHASESRATATAAAELREMLKEAGSPAEKAVIQAELAAAERGEKGPSASATGGLAAAGWQTACKGPAA